MKKGMQITLGLDGKGPFMLCWGNLDFYSKTKEKPQKFPKQVGRGKY